MIWIGHTHLNTTHKKKHPDIRNTNLIL